MAPKSHQTREEILAEYYPLDRLLEQNDINPLVVVKYLVDEGLIDLDDYFFEDMDHD